MATGGEPWSGSNSLALESCSNPASRSGFSYETSLRVAVLLERQREKCCSCPTALPPLSQPSFPPLSSTSSVKMAAEELTSPPVAGASTTDASTNIRDLKPVIKNVDMSEEMQAETIEIAYLALEQFTVEKDMAGHVKRTMDQKFGPTWHAVVGQRYGSYVTHETKHFIYFCKCACSTSRCSLVLRRAVQQTQNH